MPDTERQTDKASLDLRQPPPAGTPPAAPPGKAPRIFYGWYIVGVAWFSMFFTFGIMSFAFVTFFVTWEEEFGWSRGLISGALSAGLVLSALAMPLVGRLADALGPRRLILLGALLEGTGILLLGRMTGALELYAYYLLASLGFAALGVVPVGVLVSRWFEARRGLALGIAQTGMGAGGIVMSQLTASLIEAIEWRDALLVLALLIWSVMLPLTLLVARSRPEDKGLLPDGRPGPGATAVPAERKEERRFAQLPGLSLGEALRTWQYWAIAFIFFAGGLASSGVFSQIRPFMDDLGFSLRVAAIALSSVGAANIIGKLLYGYFADKVSVRAILTIAILGIMVVPLSVLSVTALGAPRGVAFLAPLGVGGPGAAVSLLPPLVLAATFGLRHLGSLVGAIISIETVGLGVGPVVIGSLFDLTGSYTSGSLLFLGALLLALFLPFVAAPARRPAPAARAQGPAADS